MQPFEKLAFDIKRPRATHTRPATCEEVVCEFYRDGWASVIDERTEHGQQMAHYIRTSGRSFIEVTEPGGATMFTFRGGQPCFAQHRADIEREPLYVARSSRGRVRKHTAETWVDDFATEAQNLHDFIERHG